MINKLLLLVLASAWMVEVLAVSYNLRARKRRAMSLHNLSYSNGFLRMRRAQQLDISEDYYDLSHATHGRCDQTREHGKKDRKRNRKLNAWEKGCYDYDDVSIQSIEGVVLQTYVPLTGEDPSFSKPSPSPSLTITENPTAESEVSPSPPTISNDDDVDEFSVSNEGTTRNGSNGGFIPDPLSPQPTDTPVVSTLVPSLSPTEAPIFPTAAPTRETYEEITNEDFRAPTNDD